MKCAIVTVYNSPNCGSYLQAYALMRIAESLGLEPYVYRMNRSESDNTCRNAAKMLMKLDFSGCKRTVSQSKRFGSACGVFRETTETDLPVYLLGSDTIWDLSIDRFQREHDIFWGQRFDSRRIISYAPSIGFAGEEAFEKAAWVGDALSRMTSISVREQRAADILCRYTDKDISVVCDPTLLLHADEYCKLGRGEGERCIFLYYYGKVPEDMRSALTAFARNKGLKIITFGSANTWCDACEPYDPVRFLELYHSAEFIVTNTFHGTVFSHIYQKNFVVLKNNRPKVYDFLKKMGTSGRAAESAGDIAQILSLPVNFSDAEKRMEEERSRGLKFLKESLEMN